MQALCTPRTRRTLVCLAILTAFASAPARAAETDHREFEATLHAPYKGDASQQEARTFTLRFAYPHLAQPQSIAWTLEVVAPNGAVVKSWDGKRLLSGKAVEVSVRWNGRDGDRPLDDGIYKVRMSATAHELVPIRAGGIDEEPVTETQEWDIQVGQVAAPDMPAFAPLAVAGEALPPWPPHGTAGTPVSTAGVQASSAPQGQVQMSGVARSVAATASLPYTVYYGNLHSQTNHSDGGGALSSCTGAQNPQSAALGPTDAFTYARGKGLDFLMASEHNHMYDGSDSTNTSASPATAKSLYQSGLSAASTFNAGHPDFLGIYGLEWGVISNGGHMNIFNSSELLGWEYNSSNQLLADTFTAKSDYAALYTLMRQRGWIGQFNHPSTSGQFLVNGVPLGYTADGDQAMVMCEVLNTSAFSTNTTETETSRSSYEGACRKALEAGYHIAFSTDQDNHCANWGASYTNRTAVLIPTGQALTTANFMDALKARRVFATMDKTSQLIFTANGHVMGERFANSGSLSLAANFASTSGKTASTVEIYEGVPGRNGTVTLLASTATATVTPANGEHFYYAKITQNDGNILWSAPVWVSQGAGSGDTSAPTVSASVSGTSTLTFAANASDNVGVTKVEFYVDGALKGTDTSAPYSMTLASTALANGTHSLTAKAYDAAGNNATSAPASFSVNNTTGATQLIVNGGFESGTSSWTATSGVITNDTSNAPHGGSYYAWLDGYGAAHTDSVYQQMTIPSTATTATLGFWLKVISDETTTTTVYDTLKVQVRNSSNTVLATLATYSNLNKGSTWAQKTFDLSAYKGQTIRVYFLGVEGSSVATSFLLDDISVTAQ
ncbi:carbohydrate-binding protein CenC [Massilia arenosa]|uniref:Carbohydrate-binding protein CenC n=1 Tax=Zemynaea arenosa TaxID=2561931 RepID=A0A4Y9SA06_9BURK|nr:CehA/McbA family metallohydrolase [Massilia arenosa]TFW16932.1 carbohydrate-binding protein CenC [Massilia arenosa]